MPANEESIELFNLASDDFKSCDGLIKMDLVTHVVFFLAQQTVEKSMKSVLASQHIIYPKTHNLAKINLLLKENNITSPFSEQSLKQLIPFAADCRYGLPDVEFPDAKEMLSVAETAINWCKKQIYD